MAWRLGFNWVGQKTDRDSRGICPHCLLLLRSLPRNSSASLVSRILCCFFVRKFDCGNAVHRTVPETIRCGWLDGSVRQFPGHVTAITISVGTKLTTSTASVGIVSQQGFHVDFLGCKTWGQLLLSFVASYEEVSTPHRLDETLSSVLS